MICASVVSSGDKAISDFIKANSTADIIELRLDMIGDLDFTKLRAIKKKPVIVACRSKAQNGKYLGTEKQRLDYLLHSATAMQADYVDVELETSKGEITKFRKAGIKNIIVSYHNFRETPKNLPVVYQKIAESGADIAKIVVMAKAINDNLKIFSLLRQAAGKRVKLIAFCMGTYGAISRILYKKFGSLMTYSSIEEGKESAPGQVTAAELKQSYHADKLSEMTKLFGVAGSPEKHSSSPAFFNAAYKAAGVDAVHVKFPVNDIGQFVKGYRQLISGFAVTMPHKETIMPYLDELDKTAREVGAVNTVVKKGGKLKGHNTDLTGGIMALKGKTELKGKQIVILGAGGAAKAMIHGTIKEGAKVTILNRTLKKAEEFARKNGCNYGSIEKLRNINYDILINCTPLGMDGERFLDRRNIRKGTVVMDLVYLKSGETKLIEDANLIGCSTVSGKEMLIMQALQQFRLWTGKEPPEDVMRKALEKANA